MSSGSTGAGCDALAWAVHLGVGWAPAVDSGDLVERDRAWTDVQVPGPRAAVVGGGDVRVVGEVCEVDGEDGHAHLAECDDHEIRCGVLPLGDDQRCHSLSSSSPMLLGMAVESVPPMASGTVHAAMRGLVRASGTGRSHVPLSRWARSRSGHITAEDEQSISEVREKPQTDHPCARREPSTYRWNRP